MSIKDEVKLDRINGISSFTAKCMLHKRNINKQQDGSFCLALFVRGFYLMQVPQNSAQDGSSVDNTSHIL